MNWISIWIQYHSVWQCARIRLTQRTWIRLTEAILQIPMTKYLHHGCNGRIGYCWQTIIQPIISVTFHHSLLIDPLTVANVIPDINLNKPGLNQTRRDSGNSIERCRSKFQWHRSTWQAEHWSSRTHVTARTVQLEWIGGGVWQWKSVWSSALCFAVGSANRVIRFLCTNVPQIRGEIQ